MKSITSLTEKVPIRILMNFELVTSQAWGKKTRLWYISNHQLNILYAAEAPPASRLQTLQPSSFLTGQAVEPFCEPRHQPLKFTPNNWRQHLGSVSSPA